MRFLQLSSVSLAVALFCAPRANSQVLYGTLVGTITDQSSAVIPSAVVVITHQGTGQTRETKADAEGRYRFPNLQAGTYDLKVIATGFRTLTRSIAVTINNVSRVPIEMEVGQVSDQ